MSRLDVVLDDGEFQFTVARGQVVVVGRSDNCDVTVPHASLTRKHWTFDYSGELCLIQACGFGATGYLGTKPVTPKEWLELADGAEIRMGALKGRCRYTPDD